MERLPREKQKALEQDIEIGEHIKVLVAMYSMDNISLASGVNRDTIYSCKRRYPKLTMNYRKYLTILALMRYARFLRRLHRDYTTHVLAHKHGVTRQYVTQTRKGKNLSKLFPYGKTPLPPEVLSLGDMIDQ